MERELASGYTSRVNGAAERALERSFPRGSWALAGRGDASPPGCAGQPCGLRERLRRWRVVSVGRARPRKPSQAEGRLGRPWLDASRRDANDARCGVRAGDQRSQRIRGPCGRQGRASVERRRTCGSTGGGVQPMLTRSSLDEWNTAMGILPCLGFVLAESREVFMASRRCARNAGVARWRCGRTMRRWLPVRAAMCSTCIEGVVGSRRDVQHTRESFDEGCTFMGKKRNAAPRTSHACVASSRNGACVPVMFLHAMRGHPIG